MHLSTEQQTALRKVVSAKLALWDASNEAEKLLGCDIDTNGAELEGLCSMIPNDYEVPEHELREAFELDDACGLCECGRHWNQCAFAMDEADEHQDR